MTIRPLQKFDYLKVTRFVCANLYYFGGLTTLPNTNTYNVAIHLPFGNPKIYRKLDKGIKEDLSSIWGVKFRFFKLQNYDF